MSKIPKILLVGPAFRNGGAEKRFYNLCRYLFKGTAHACTLHSSNISEDTSNMNLMSLGWKSMYDYPAVIIRLMKIIQKGQYDVIMGFGLYPNLVIWLATRVFTKKPILILSEITRPGIAYLSQPKSLKREFIRILQQMAYQSADMFAANSIDGIRESVDYFNVRENLTKRIPNIINENEVIEKAEQPLNISHISRHKHKIAVVSRLVKMKRIDTAIEAMAMLPKDIDCAMVIAGDGPELPNLKQLAQDLGIAERVFFIGWLENPLPLIRQSSAYVICSEYEGFSNSVLEAMFADTPVITSFCSTDAKQMCQQGAALGFETGDAETLSKHFLTLMNSKQEKEQLIHEARQYRSWHECKTAIAVYEQTISEAFEKFQQSEQKTRKTITSKQDLEFYLEADRLALQRPVRTLSVILKEFIADDEVWKFQRLLRKCEYYKNKKKNWFEWASFLYHYRKFVKLSARLGFTIPLNSFGPGLSIAHHGTIVVSGKAEIGENCRIHVCVNIGASATDGDAAPQLGNNIYIGPGAKLFGSIKLSDNIVIGANSVVNKSFEEENIIIAGVPAKKIRNFDIDEIKGFVRATEIINKRSDEALSKKD